MLTKRLLAALAAISLSAAPVLAQPAATTMAPSGAPAGAPSAKPPVTAPAATPSTQPAAAPVVAPSAAKPAASAATTQAAVPAAKKTNLNTATAAELDALPNVGQARAKIILAERAKGPFKDWNDFDKRMKGTHVNHGVRAKIQDRVTF